MDEHATGTTRRPARILLYAGVPVAALTLLFGALYLFGDAKAPRVPSGVKINHAFKQDTVGLSCDACHEPNPSNARFMTFPNHETCGACHADEVDENSPNKNCALCHTQPDNKTWLRKDQVLSPLVRFDHTVHQKAGVDCAKCHTVFDKDVLTGNEMLPTMDTCVKCHADQKVAGGTSCTFCHVKGLETIKPQTHDSPEWKIVHGKGLNKDLIAANCTVCHTKELNNSCTKCHHQAPLTFVKTVACSTCHGAGWDTSRPKDHTPLWVTSHGKGLTQTRIDQRCSLCHNQASGNDCQSCHRREAPASHTIGWVQNLHGNAVRTNRQSCTTCHDQSECISCHNTTPPFTHTASWGAPYDRHCVSCHVEGGGYVSGGMQGNCGVCHSSTDVFAFHTSQAMPIVAHNTSLNCTSIACHTFGSALGPQHPSPKAGNAVCITCHTH
jgi:hypothetical protein